MTTLRSISDLELVALVVTFHELQTVVANGGSLAVFQVLELAIRGVTRELIARRAGRPESLGVFPPELALEEFRDLLKCVQHGAERLRHLDFVGAAEFLEARLAEICVDVSGIRPNAGVELRTLN